MFVWLEEDKKCLKNEAVGCLFSSVAKPKFCWNWIIPYQVIKLLWSVCDTTTTGYKPWWIFVMFDSLFAWHGYFWLSKNKNMKNECVYFFANIQEIKSGFKILIFSWVVCNVWLIHLWKQYNKHWHSLSMARWIWPSFNRILLEQGTGTALKKCKSHYSSHLPKSCLSER